MAQRSRVVGYDYLRILSIFMVVLMHGLVAFLGGSDPSQRLMAMELNTVCLISVPCFFMLSGALLLDDRSENVFCSLRKRFVKQAIPFLLWSLLYVLARIAMKKISFGPQVFTGLLQKPAYYQFWFMYTLLAIYLLLPVLSSLVQSLDKKVFQYLLGIWLIFSVLQPTLAAFVPQLRLSEHVDLILCEGYLGYFLLGYYLKQYGGTIRRETAIWMLFGGSAITMALTAVVYVFVSAKAAAIFYGGYLTPGVVLASSGAFLLFQNTAFRANALVICMSDISVGIFYVHMLVLTAFEHIGFTGADNLLVCVLKVIATYAVSAMIAFVISKIPGLRKILLGMNG